MDTDITNISQEFDNILNSFTQKISNLNNFKVHIEHSTEQTCKHYIEVNESMKEHEKEDKITINMNSTLYWDIERGTRECLETNINKFGT